MSTVPLILHHAQCNDGFAAAWVAWTYFQHQCECIPVHYNQPPPEASFSGPPRDILILDFSYPRPALVELAARNSSVTVLDHHKTAAMDLALLPAAPSIAEWEERRGIGFNFPLSATFDMARSGASLTWDFFHPGESRPPLVDYVEDRDLWRFSDPDTRSIHAALSSYDHDFMTWTGLAQQMETPDGLLSLISEGQTLDRRHLQLCDEIIATSRRMMMLGGHVVPVCNAPYSFASDIGNKLCKGHPFAATYVDHSGGRTFSLRSSNAAVDVSEVAKHYGGGGHRNAAGFTTRSHWEGEQEIPSE